MCSSTCLDVYINMNMRSGPSGVYRLAREECCFRPPPAEGMSQVALVLLHLDHLLGVLVEQLAVAHGVIEREAG